MIDWMRVKELRSEVGVDDFDEVVALFLEEVEDCLARLDPHAGAEQLEADMHFLKGSALNLGFSDFAALCQVGETQASQGDCTSVNADAVKTSFQQSKRMFDQSIANKVA